MRFFRAEVLFFCVALAVAAAQDLTPAERRRREYPMFSDLADRAQAVTPELRSIILTRIAKQASLKDREWKEELLEQAFDAAQLAHIESQVDIVPAPNGPMPNGLPPRYERGNAMNKGIDRLSLSTAAVTAMIAVNPAKARTLFDRIQLAEPRQLNCSEGLIADTSKYFETATRLAPANPDILGLAMQKATSATQMGAIPKMALGANPEIIQSFAGLLTAIPVESRAWSSAIDDFTSNMSKLVDSASPSERTILLNGWRSFLSRGLKAVPCAEVSNPSWGSEGWRTRAIGAHDQRSVLAGFEPLGPSEFENKTTPDSGCVDSETKSSDRVKQLTKDGIQFLAAGEAKKDVEWQARFKQFINEIEGVKKDETSEDPILFKAGLFSFAASAAPPGPLRELVSARFLDQLKIADVTSDAFAAWYTAVNDWMDLLSVLGQSKEKSLERLETSGQAMLIAITKLNKLN